MKKLLLLLLVFFAFSQGKAQFYEGFEGGTYVPETGDWNLASGNWKISDNGIGAGFSWEPNTIVATPAYQVDGAVAAYINRENIGMGNTSEDWLVTPAVSVPSDGALSFYTRTTTSGDQGTDYQVLVSTTSQTDHSSFVPIAYWNEGSLTATFNIYERKSISLDAYVGQSVYIAFVRRFFQPYLQVGGDRWLIDAVSVAEEEPIATTPINYIVGEVTYNLDNNGCQQNSMINTVRIAATNGVQTYYKYAYDGTYEMTVTGTNLVVTPGSYNQEIFDSTPPSYTFNFTGSGNTGVADFCLSPNGNAVHDLSIEIIPYNSSARPGFDSHYLITVRNLGNLPEDCVVSFSFDDDIFDFVWGTDGYILSPGNVSWNLNDIPPLSHRDFLVTLNLNSPTETPPVNAGDQLEFLATVTMPDDSVAENNSAVLEQTVINAYDPNDKSVNEGATITPEQADDYLHYVIRFQNTGSATASIVRITDDLSSNLDLGTLDITSWSHDVRLALDGNRAEFLFDDIDLPPSTENESGSHGYVAYRIKPIAGIALGNSISNTAKIYFDFNFPIITNTVTTTVSALAVSDLAKNVFSLYPNPASQSVTIEMPNDANVETISVFNLLGQKIKTIAPEFENRLYAMDISDMAAGTYLIQLISENGKKTKKLIKL